MDEDRGELISLTADIVSAQVSNNKLNPQEVPELIRSVFATLNDLTKPAVPDAEPQQPAVPIRASIKHDYIICLEDGAKLKMLKRYLRTRYEMTPEEYRAKWNLPRDYPMVAPAYAEQRRTLAHAIGLGRTKVEGPVVVAPATRKKKTPAEAKAAKAAANETAQVTTPKKRGRPPKAASEATPTASKSVEA